MDPLSTKSFNVAIPKSGCPSFEAVVPAPVMYRHFAPAANATLALNPSYTPGHTKSGTNCLEYTDNPVLLCKSFSNNFRHDCLPPQPATCCHLCHVQSRSNPLSHPQVACLRPSAPFIRYRSLPAGDRSKRSSCLKWLVPRTKVN